MADSVRYIFEQARAGTLEGQVSFPAGTKFDIPFLLDSKGRSPIQLALGTSDSDEPA